MINGSDGRIRNRHIPPDLTSTWAGEPLEYLVTPDPVISSDVVTVPPGGVSRRMAHPISGYVYVLQR